MSINDVRLVAINESILTVPPHPPKGPSQMDSFIFSITFCAFCEGFLGSDRSLQRETMSGLTGAEWTHKSRSSHRHHHDDWVNFDSGSSSEPSWMCLLFLLDSNQFFFCQWETSTLTIQSRRKKARTYLTLDISKCVALSASFSPLPKGKEKFLATLHRHMEIHGTVYYETQRPPEVPAFVKNHGLLPQPELQQLLRKAKVGEHQESSPEPSSCKAFGGVCSFF